LSLDKLTERNNRAKLKKALQSFILKRLGKLGDPLRLKNQLFITAFCKNFRLA